MFVRHCLNRVFSSAVTIPKNNFSQAELDSHADTCAFGDSALIIQDTLQCASVSPFLRSFGSLDNVRIVTAANAYDCPDTFTTFILYFPQSLYIPELDRLLIAPNQLRSHGITINETPLFALPPDQRHADSHSIISPEHSMRMRIPLQLDGVISYFPTRKPTGNKIRDHDRCVHVEMCSSYPWEPYADHFTENETLLRADVSTAYHFPNCSIHASTTSRRQGTVTPQQLAERWRIGLDTAKRTLLNTTQLAVRNFTHTTGGRRLKLIHYQLKAQRLSTTMYTDTMISPIRSLHGNNVSQVFSTPFQWVCAYLYPSRSDTHNSLDRLFSEAGIPIRMRPDNAKELILLGEWKRKLQRFGCQLDPIEAHTPNLNLAELAIRELKRLFRRLMISLNAPAVLWDYCFELAALICSHTCLALDQLNGNNPETMLLGDTSNNSFLAEFAWYNYVWYHVPAGPEMQNRLLGRWLGPSTDCGEAMSSYVLTQTGQVVSRTSVYPLSTEDRNSEAVSNKKKQFEERLAKTLGPQIAGMVFDDDELAKDPYV
jgi:hypothetical protein